MLKYLIESVLTEDFRETSRYTSSHNQITHVYYTQYFDDLPIQNAVLNVNLDSNDKIISFGQISYSKTKDDQLVLGYADVAAISPMTAVEYFLEFVKADKSQLVQNPQEMSQDPHQAYHIQSSLTNAPIPATLKYILKENGDLNLVWDMGTLISFNPSCGFARKLVSCTCLCKIRNGFIGYRLGG